MTSDQNKQITSITYNHLNLPKKVTFAGNYKYIEYVYDATGVKLKKLVSSMNSNNTVENAITEYLGGFQYTSKTGLLGVVELQFFPTAEGYVKNTVINSTNNYNYVYNYTDHLGNIRLSYAYDDQTGTVQPLDEHHYYPFGLELINIANSAKMEFKGEPYTYVEPSTGKTVTITKPMIVQVANSGYQYQYNGKEFQDELGLNWYDYGGRMYSPEIARWNGIDISSEKYYESSSYHYAGNNPILFVDFDGNDYGIIVNRLNNTITIKAIYISNSSNSSAIKNSTNRFNSNSEKYIFIAGSVKDLKSKGKLLDSYKINYQLSTEIDDSMVSKYISGGDQKAMDDKSGIVNSFDTIKGKFPNNEEKAGGAGEDQITMREDTKDTKLTDHEVSHTLGNGHIDQPDGTLPLTSTNSTISGISETLKGVGIGGNTIARNASTVIGNGTLLNNSNVNGLESGKVISKKRYDRIIKRLEKKNN